MTSVIVVVAGATTMTRVEYNETESVERFEAARDPGTVSESTFDGPAVCLRVARHAMAAHNAKTTTTVADAMTDCHSSPSSMKTGRVRTLRRVPNFRCGISPRRQAAYIASRGTLYR